MLQYALLHLCGFDSVSVSTYICTRATQIAPPLRAYCAGWREEGLLLMLRVLPGQTV